MGIATRSRRLNAAALDVLFVYLLQGAVFASLVLSDGKNAGAFVVADFLLVLAYGAVELLTGATPAKRLLELRVRTPSGEEAGRGALFGRWAIKFLPIAGGLAANVALLAAAVHGSQDPMAVVFPSTLSGFLLMFALFDFAFSFGEARRALRDRLTGTAVADLAA